MPKLAAILTTIGALLTQLIGVTVMVTTRATGEPGIASTTGLTLTTAGFITALAATPPAIRAIYVWSRDRGYRLYHEHQAQDAALTAAPAPSAVVPLNRATHP
ncbi:MULTISPECIES: hypothetical protein [Streptomyces rochei group]|uniref:hypothetical protein n=1 Tax=Streptomyces rochei group TaxID=2867164 RepID=UPI0018774BBB|nr:hypothetical protein [Streptomyces vinaceusdrappus]GHC44228.1 hypothetical protein GCM10010308_74310 [Streptomyces vinaceusdrappus]